MAKSRSHFLNVLQELSSVQIEKMSEDKLISDASTTRIFDDCPSFFSPKEIEYLALIFKSYIQSVTNIQMTEKGFILLDQDNKNKIYHFEKLLIQLANRELLSTNGDIKPIVRQALNWEKHFNKDEIVGIVCAFVFTIYQDIISHLYTQEATLMESKCNELAAIYHFINTNYRRWAQEDLNKKYFSSSVENSLFAPVKCQSPYTSKMGVPIGGVLYFSPRSK